MADNKTHDAPPLTEQVAEKAKQQTQQVKDQAQQVVQQGQQKVSQVWELGRSQFRGVLTGQKNRAADSLGDVAQMLQESAGQLKGQGHAGSSRLADSLAQRVTALSTSVHEKEIEEIIADTEDFARRQPAVFLTIAMVIGVILARFLKSSGQSA